MFVNSELGEIFLVDSATNTIHAASRFSEACGVSGEKNGHFGVLCCASQKEKDLMIVEFGREYPFLSFCPHCFADAKTADTKTSAGDDAAQTATADGQEKHS